VDKNSTGALRLLAMMMMMDKDAAASSISQDACSSSRWSLIPDDWVGKAHQDQLVAGYVTALALCFSSP
jgi:hypothetical protein